MRLKNLIPTLAFAFGIVAGGCESKADLARKPGLIDSLVQQSIEQVDTNYVVSKDGVAYEKLLRAALKESTTKDLATLKDHNIVIALDRRLSTQVNGTWDEEMDAVLYNNNNVSGTLSLWDNGKLGGFFSRGSDDNASMIISALAEDLREGNVPADMDVGICAVRSRRIGKTTTYYAAWEKANDFDKDTRKKNEALLRRSTRRKQDSLDSAGGSW